MNKKVLIAIGAIAILLGGLFTYLVRPKEIKPPPVKENSIDQSELQSMHKQASLLAKEGNLLKAKALYEKIVMSSSDAKFVTMVQKNLWDLNIEILFSSVLTPDDETYTVKAGDTLGGIAERFNTTIELLMKSNGLKGDRIIPGRNLKVSTAKYSVIVDKSQNILTLKSDEDVLKTYMVSTGQNNSTPTGSFKVVNRLENPVWYKSGIPVPAGSPDNILGSRWIGISRSGYGIHGSPDSEPLGRQNTKGCVRMDNDDVKELYTILPIGATVVIVD